MQENYLEKHLLTSKVKFVFFLLVQSMTLDEEDAEIIKKNLVKYPQGE